MAPRSPRNVRRSMIFLRWRFLRQSLVLLSGDDDRRTPFACDPQGQQEYTPACQCRKARFLRSVQGLAARVSVNLMLSMLRQRWSRQNRLLSPVAASSRRQIDSPGALSAGAPRVDAGTRHWIEGPRCLALFRMTKAVILMEIRRVQKSFVGSGWREVVCG
jgi:hypothetical protein